MCGLVAIARLNPAASLPPPEKLRAMTDALAHRGPDAAATRYLDGGRAAFGFRRLSIVNLGQDGDQPMSDADGQVTVVFNGEIYNHLELRRTLQTEGRIFRTRNSDTEALLQGYLHWGGDELLSRLHGMFAFAIWDGRKNELFAARDRLGIKPLYYAEISGQLVLASEIKAIALHPDFTARMNDGACRDILNVLATPSPETLFDGVFKLGCGETLILGSSGDLRKRRWWSLPETPESGGPSIDEAAAEVERLARRAVKARLAEEVEACVFLSGGVDSSFVLGAAAEAGKSLKSFTAAFSGDPLNEAKEAALVAQRFGSEHRVVEIEEGKAMAALTRLMSDMDEPIADWASIPLQFLANAVHGANIKVGLVGEGADELFCGYPAWRGFIEERRLWRSLSGVKAAEGAFRHAAMRTPFKRFGLIGALDVASSVARRQGRFRSGAEAMRFHQAERILKPGAARAAPRTDPASVRAQPADLDLRLAELGEGYPDSAHSPGEIFSNMRRRDLRFRLPELLLMRVDKITMGASIEARVPFLDHYLVEYVARLPANLVLEGGGGKPLLKRAAKSLLPSEVLDRPKIGLGAPMSKWMREGLREEIRGVLEDEADDATSPFDGGAVRALFARHVSGAKDYGSYLLPIISIAMWRRKWLH
ncbi:MAG: asparagine synthase (glutamine-hydrolyzing) [Parvularculaceae bacterium]